MRRRAPGPLDAATWAMLTDQPGGRPLLKFATARLRALWSIYEVELLAWWVARYPGTRPSTWWKVCTPEPRYTESQQRYLRQLGLALPGELECVPRRGFKPRRRGDDDG